MHSHGVSRREDGLVPLADMALAQKSAGAEILVGTANRGVAQSTGGQRFDHSVRQRR